MDGYGRAQGRGGGGGGGGGGGMKCCMCIDNKLASYIIAGVTLVLVIIGVGYGAVVLHYVLNETNVSNTKIAVSAIIIVKNLIMVAASILLFAAIYKGISNWFYPALLGYLLYVVLTITDVAVLFSTSEGFAPLMWAYTVPSILLPIYFFIVVNYYKREVVQSESRVGVQNFNAGRRY